MCVCVYVKKFGWATEISVCVFLRCQSFSWSTFFFFFKSISNNFFLLLYFDDLSNAIDWVDLPSKQANMIQVFGWLELKEKKKKNTNSIRDASKYQLFACSVRPRKPFNLTWMLNLNRIRPISSSKSREYTKFLI